MKKSKTQRGFSLIEFEDRYGQKCSIQKSSLATEDALWVGIDDPEPQIMASQAANHGIMTDQKTGWIPYLIHSDVLLKTRMHISIENAKMLIEVLSVFVETGELPD